MKGTFLLLVTQRNQIHHQYLGGQQDAHRLPIQNGSAQKRHGRPVIHRRARDVERERLDNVVHQDAKVIAQVSAGNSECPHAAQHEDVATSDQRVRDVIRGGALEQRVRRLRTESSLIAEKPVSVLRVERPALTRPRQHGEADSASRKIPNKKIVMASA